MSVKSENTNSTNSTEVQLTYDRHSGMPVFPDVVDGSLVNRLLSAEDITAIPDTFPPFSRSVLLYYKSSHHSKKYLSHHTRKWMRSYAIIKGRYIFLTKCISDQTPLRIIPLEQITFLTSDRHKRKSPTRNKNNNSENNSENCFSEFEIRINGKRSVSQESHSDVRILSQYLGVRCIMPFFVLI